MKRKELTVLPIEQWSILHTIRISKDWANKKSSIGEILYKRDFMQYTNKSYSFQELQKVDEFDTLVFNAVKEKYPDAERMQEMIMWDSQEDDINSKIAFPKQKIPFLFDFKLETLYDEYEGKRTIKKNFLMNLFIVCGDSEIFKDETFFIKYEPSQEKRLKEIMDNVKYTHL